MNSTLGSVVPLAMFIKKLLLMQRVNNSPSDNIMIASSTFSALTKASVPSDQLEQCSDWDFAWSKSQGGGGRNPLRGSGHDLWPPEATPDQSCPSTIIFFHIIIIIISGHQYYSNQLWPIVATCCSSQTNQVFSINIQSKKLLIYKM